MDEMSIWQAQTVFAGWNKAHNPDAEKPGNKLSEKEKDEIWEWMQEKEIDDNTVQNGRIQ
jgi:hypothetical protein